MNLFIIGNGFDLGHDLPTQYWRFRMFLEENYSEFLNDFEDKYDLWGEKSKTPLWNEFESYLANIQEDVLFEEMYQSTDLGLESGNVGIEDTLTDYFKRGFSYIEDLSIYLKEWIEQANQELNGQNKRTSFIVDNSHDIFLNFNYTTTLEDLYSIEEENVLHIHGVVNSDEDLVLGHSNLDRITYFREKYSEAQNIGDEQSSPIYVTLAEYCSSTYKDVKDYIYRLLLLDLKSIEKITIIGHSLSDVDLPYFKEIKRIIGKDVEWDIIYHLENQENEFKEKIIKIGVNEQQIHMLHSSEFYDLPILEQISLKI